MVWQPDGVVRWPGGTYIKCCSPDLLLLDDARRQINQNLRPKPSYEAIAIADIL
jgi:hypothetical protein